MGLKLSDNLIEVFMSRPTGLIGSIDIIYPIIEDHQIWDISRLQLHY